MKTNSGIGVRAVLGLGVVAAAVAGAASLHSPGAPSRVEVVAPKPAVVGIALNESSAPVPVNPGDLASTHAIPKYLPAGAESTGGKTTIHGGWAEHYTLPGKVNSREMPDAPAMPVAGVPSHPATGIDLVELPQTISTFSRGTADPRLATVSTITVMGVPATVLTPNNGYGTYRISWVVNGVAYDLQSQRLKAGGDEGTSGIPIDELIRVAQSIG